MGREGTGVPPAAERLKCRSPPASGIRVCRLRIKQGFSFGPYLALAFREITLCKDSRLSALWKQESLCCYCANPLAEWRQMMVWLGRDPKYHPASIVFCRHHCDACRKYQVSSSQPSACGFKMVPRPAALCWFPGSSVWAESQGLQSLQLDPPFFQQLWGNDGLSVALQRPFLLNNHRVKWKWM